MAAPPTGAFRSKAPSHLEGHASSGLSSPRRFAYACRGRSRPASNSKPPSRSRDGSYRRSCASARRRARSGFACRGTRRKGGRTILGFEDDAQRRKILKEAGLRDRSFVATDVGVDIELKRWGTRETVLRKA